MWKFQIKEKGASGRLVKQFFEAININIFLNKMISCNRRIKANTFTFSFFLLLSHGENGDRDFKCNNANISRSTRFVEYEKNLAIL